MPTSWETGTLVQPVWSVMGLMQFFKLDYFCSCQIRWEKGKSQISDQSSNPGISRLHFWCKVDNSGLAPTRKLYSSEVGFLKSDTQRIASSSEYERDICRPDNWRHEKPEDLQRDVKLNLDFRVGKGSHFQRCAPVCFNFVFCLGLGSGIVAKCERERFNHSKMWEDKVLEGRDSKLRPTFQALRVVCIKGVILGGLGASRD